MKKNKKLLSLIGSLTLLTTPVIMVTACSSYDLERYSAALPNDIQNRILFDFIGVNYSVDAKTHFNNIYQQGMELIKKDVEGIIAQQEFFNFFTKKLNYSPDEANNAFEEIKDNLGLNILANDYFDSVNNGENFDNKSEVKVIFQTDGWHENATSKFDYLKAPSHFYDDKNPNIYLGTKLYDFTDPKNDEIIKSIVKYADDPEQQNHYKEDVNSLIENETTWGNKSEVQKTPPILSTASGEIPNYQLKLQRFKWLLRFRYQQYYSSVILPELNQTLFTMAYILNLIVKINNQNGTSEILLDDGSIPSQLQDWMPNQTWKSKYHLVWDYTTGLDNATTIDSNWDAEENSSALKDLMIDKKTLNIEFFNKLTQTEKKIKNSVDPIFGINGFINNTSSKPYNEETTAATQSGWAESKDGFHYWGNNTTGAFAYSAPIYLIDVILNLDFNFYKNENSMQNKLIVNPNSDKNSAIYRSWTSVGNTYIYNSLFSQYIRADYLADADTTLENYTQKQEMKWNIFWQMLYSLASQLDSNPNKENATNNFDKAAKELFPTYIDKNKIYNIDFWNAVSSYY